MICRVANQKDLPVLLQFGKELSLVEANFDKTIVFDEEEARSRYALQLANPLVFFLIAEIEEKQPIGYLYAHIDQSDRMKQGEIEVVFVSEEYRGQRIAQELVETALQWMKDHQVSRVLAHIFAENKPSRKAFERLGFKPHNIEYLLEIM